MTDTITPADSSSGDDAVNFAARGPKRSLKSLVMRGSAWTLAGQLSQMVLQIGGNVILARLLFPSAFGLMAMAQVITRGLEMFSDVGIRGSVLYHERGDDPRFLDTAWTIQVIRGGILLLCCCALAYPAAVFYQQPILAAMLPVMGVAALLRGFVSTAQFTLNRHIQLDRIVMWETAIHAFSLVVLIVWALLHRSVWALVGGGVITTVARVLTSHMLIPRYHNGLAWDREAAKSMARFGKWVLLSTMLTFFLTQGDKAILGKVLDGAALLGIYTLAANLATKMVRLMDGISTKVLHPVFVRLDEQKPKARRRNVRRLRITLLALGLPPIWLMAVGGYHVIDLLYDDRYLSAGWMLQLLAVGAIGSVIISTTDRVLLARGDSFSHMCVQATQTSFYVAGMLVGASVGGVEGLITGMVVAQILNYFPLAVALHKYDIWLPWLDAAAFGISTLVIAVGLWIVWGAGPLTWGWAG